MLPNSWRRLLTLIRILLAMSCLATQLIYSSFVWTNTAILFAAYVIYACVVLFWRSLEDSGYPTIALLIDFGFFFYPRSAAPPTRIGLLRSFTLTFCWWRFCCTTGGRR